MSRIRLISALLLAGLTVSAQSAQAQSTGQADQQAPAKKGPLGGLLEPWDGKGDEITPRTIHLGDLREPRRPTDGNKPKPEATATEPAAKKKGPLSGLLQSWADKSDVKPTAVAKADQPAAKKAGWFSGLQLQPWHESSAGSAEPKSAKTEAVAEAPAHPQTTNVSAPGLRLQRWGEKDDSSSGG